MRLRVTFTAIIAVGLAALTAFPNATASGKKGAAPSFIVVCKFSHRLPDDPLVHAKMPGMSHSHDFFGNTTTNAYSTLKSLEAGGTTCDQRADKAAYWAPTAYKNGVALKPRAATIYYRNTGADLSAIKVPPPGFAMIAGNTPGTKPLDGLLTGWSCRRPNGTKAAWIQGVPTCARGEDLVFRVVFPECWNGRLDSADHRSHVARILKNGTCPSTHPYLIPRISMTVRYDSRGGKGITLSSGGPVDGAHMDFFNAWNSRTLHDLVRRCLLSRHDHCGFVGKSK